MASSKEGYYSVSNPFRGRLVIINNVNFKFTDDRVTRDGTDKDTDRLKTTFVQMGFEITVHKDLTCLKMLQAMTDVKSKISGYDCLAVAILTHGADGGFIYGIDGYADSLDSILQPLKEITTGIPKLIFVQACRGTKLDAGHKVQADDPGGRTETNNYIRVPMEADFLYHFSTSPGFFSFRNSTKGSVFIQSLCNVFDQHIKDGSEIHLLKSLVDVNRKVAEEYTSYVTNPDNLYLNDMKQMPSLVCMLRKDLVLKKQ